MNARAEFRTEAERKAEIRRLREQWCQANRIVSHPIKPDWHGCEWYVATVKLESRRPGDPTYEMLARNELEARGLAVYVPCGVRRERKTAKNGKRLRSYAHVPYLLLPGYVVVGTAGAVQVKLSVLHDCRWIGGMLGHDGVPSRVRFDRLKELADSVDKGEFDESLGYSRDGNLPEVGEIVDILDEPFSSQPATVERVKLRKSGKDTVRVRVPFLGQERVAEIPLDSLRRGVR
ncbi:transcription termination/antitermination protein NusG [Pararhizobium sp.]|uniref:transcription termination/antitermination protein NusG n=1 Tax=Pararhizobium sp. TaxID=1977563 RepID=UPI003D127DC4